MEYENDYEAVCCMCHRTEHAAGKMIRLQKDLFICVDCMQKSFDTMNSYGLDLGGFPGMGMPGMGMPGMGPAPKNPVVEEKEEIQTEGETQTDTKAGAETGGNQEASENQGNGQNQGIPLGSIFGGKGMPNISFVNMSDLNGFPGMPQSQRLKKRKPKKKKEQVVLDIHSIPAPHKIKAKLDEYVVGQEQAKKVMSVAVYNHYKRIMSPEEEDGVEIEKSNMLLLGPTGCGKTYLVKTLANLLDVPLAITDATSLTEAGYIGDDIESVVSKLLAAADNDVDRAEHGIIFIDEIDKIAKKRNANQRDVSGESVQQGMLKLLEGAEVEVPVGASSKNGMVPMTMVDTKNILFICGGAFPDLDEIVKERLNKEASIGFTGDLKDKYDGDEDILSKATIEDIRKFGMIPEFIGRLPVMCTLAPLSEDMLVKILVEPKNAIVKQYQKLLQLDEVKLEFEDGALHSIAAKAKEKKVGARALRAILEEIMLDIMYEIPKDDNIGTVVITKDYVEKKGGPLIMMRATPALEER